jgi:N-ethylmaleimide reductase
MSNTDVLFTHVQVGELTLPNRIVLAPLTRSRAGQPGNVPTPLMAEYYTQRAGAGLIISEATNISCRARQIQSLFNRLESHDRGALDAARGFCSSLP